MLVRTGRSFFKLLLEHEAPPARLMCWSDGSDLLRHLEHLFVDARCATYAGIRQAWQKLVARVNAQPVMFAILLVALVELVLVLAYILWLSSLFASRVVAQ